MWQVRGCQKQLGTSVMKYFGTSKLWDTKDRPPVPHILSRLFSGGEWLYEKRRTEEISEGGLAWSLRFHVGLPATEELQERSGKRFLGSAPLTAPTVSGISPRTFFSLCRFSTKVTFDLGSIGDISCLRNRHRGIVSTNVVVVCCSR